MNVEIIIQGLDFHQDVEPLVKEFFPGLVNDRPVRVVLETKETEFTVSVFASEASSTSETAVVTDGVTAEGSSTPGTAAVTDGAPAEGSSAAETAIVTDDATADCFLTVESSAVTLLDRVTFTSENEKIRHRDYRNALLKGLYRALCSYTGRQMPWGVLTGVRPTKLIFERIERGEAGHLAFMEEKYCVSREKAALATRIAAVEYQLLEGIDYKHGYSLYVGIPFCPSICNYCSFGSHPIDRFSDCVEPYIEALIKEIAYAGTCFPERKLETVYFGGGTPTSISAEQLRRLLRCVKDNFDMSYVREFTVEAGRPDSITRDKLVMLLEEGVTRISINPQSMVQRTLDTIGRRHTVEQVRDAYSLARELGCDNINMDLIAGLSGESIEDFRTTLAEIERLEPDSITVHTLAHKRAARLTTDSELYAGLEATDVALMVDEAAAFMKQHGYEPYYLYRQKNMTDNLENVGYARPGKEGLYNILIMEEKQMILACGSGASSKFVRDNGDKRFERVENVKNVHEYIARIDEMIERKRRYIAENDIR